MKNFIFLFAILFCFSGCRKDPISWDIDTLFPIMHSRMTLQQAIPDSMISTGVNQELNLVYKGTLIDFRLDSVISMPDTTIQDEFFLPFGSITFQPGQNFLSDTNYTRYDLGGAQLTQLNIQSGTIRLRLSSSLNEASVLEYSLPTATKNGIPFFVKENIPAGTSSNPSVIIKSYDLSGYNISLTGINNNDFNIISNAYRAYIDSSASPVIVNQGDKFVAKTTMADITPNYARGYFGIINQNEKSNNQTIDAFKNISSGTIDLDAVSMIFRIKNEVGVDLKININELVGTNSSNNSSITLNSPLSNNTINLNRANESLGPYSSPLSTTYQTVLNSSNSNVTEFVSNIPDILSYDFDIQLNPLGNVSNSNDFIYHNTGMRIELDAEIPFKFNATNLVIVDTSDFNLNSTSQEETQKIQSGFINIYANNWYPFDLTAQFYLMDNQLSIIDSLFDTPQILKGGIPLYGIVDDPISSVLKSPVTPSKIDHIYQTKYIFTKIKVNSTDTSLTQIYSNYYVDINIVGDLKYLISIK
jgi:hypothetical protein